MQAAATAKASLVSFMIGPLINRSVFLTTLTIGAKMSDELLLRGSGAAPAAARMAMTFVCVVIDTVNHERPAYVTIK
uniref:Secreted protein n=1 Tax=Steinernema glaseri TaxID=37863 RepID=A0A1I7YP52_9BILA